MRREHHRWWSERLGRDMDLLVFGHAGAKLLVFPTRDGRYSEYENIGMIARLAPKIEAGQMQVWCLEGLAGETFYANWMVPPDRIRRFDAYERYVLDEVMPLMRRANPHDCTIAHGLSLGAHHAADIAFRHPHLFRKLAAFSGRYDLTRPVEWFGDLMGGHYEDAVYFHMPNHYLPGLDCDWRLHHLRRMDIVLVIGAEDPFLDDNLRLSGILASKTIPHRLEIWDGRAHRGSAWRKMAEIYV
ncbi:MAG: esterase family protein [Phyllobacteriaceae bacterium]|nr:esterase family protein [Phyllobacteriaceae bacterium]